ncbi:hypothetical protein [Microbacterium sp. GCS4]|uniref:hypothetical protein n=1 Tax=Microbacterium sp. GCS4 TaxID=1692239 RepID=UPI0006811FE1|nr:hypothetical protein [Microbacterium sp. GCS4]KNY05810.1 hypothetical protein AKH00_08060 [Microbacterium sp. GCS4]
MTSTSTPFRDTIVGPRWLAITGAATLVFLAVIIAVAAPAVVAEREHVGAWTVVVLLIGAVLVLGAGLLALTRRIVLSVTSAHVDAWLSPFRVEHIPLADIERIDLVDVTPSGAGGVGWRILGTDRFLLWSAGPAVRLTLSQGSTRTLRSDRAVELRAAIRNAQTSPQ